MIKFENVEVAGWEAAIRGMRNPMNSWGKSDSRYADFEEQDCVPYGMGTAFVIGQNDMNLMKSLRDAGTDHRKFMRMISVYVDITAPLYWWKEFDTYKVGTVSNSCSTMHRIAEKEFTMDDFSCEHMHQEIYDLFRLIVDYLNNIRDVYLHGGVLRVDEALVWFNARDKEIWWQMIQLLPSSYNQKRTVMMNYEVLANIYKSRKNHKLDEWCWHEGVIDGDKTNKSYIGFCDWIETLPYHELITGEFK